MDNAVVVLVGQWECSAGGTWDFVLEKKCMAQCIIVEDSLSYEELKKLIERQFAPDMKGVVGRLAYWLPSQMSVFSSGITPPVCITSDEGVKSFMKIRHGTRGVNLFVTFEAPNPSNVEGGAGNIGNEVDDSRRVNRERGVAEDEEIIRLDADTPELENRNSEVENNSGRGAMDQVVPQLEPGSSAGYDINSIIHIANSDDEEMLAQVQMMESMVAEADQALISKGKQTRSAEGNWNTAHEENDEYQVYSTEEETEDERMHTMFWNSLISREYALEYGEGSNAQREKSDGTIMLAVGETEDQHNLNRRQGKEPITEGRDEESSENVNVSGQRIGREIRDDAGNQGSARLVDNQIISEDILRGEDCPPCFGDEFLQTQQFEDGQYDARNDAIYIGRVFKNKQEMRTALAVYAIKRCFNFRQLKSDKRRLIVACVDRRCPWRVYAHVAGGTSENLEIRTATLTHTCDVATRSQYGKKASCKVIAEVLRSKFANGKDGPRAADIPAIVLDEMRVSISYMKAWHAKEVAVAEARGTCDGSYKLLLSYLHRLKQTNGGTASVVEKTDAPGEKKKFKYLFFAIGASVNAVPYMRKVVIVDGTSIKSKFKGCLLTASCQDGNFQILPIGFGVVNSENDRAWAWFFTQLTEIIPDADDLVFVSDRHTSISSALRSVYPRAAHGACAVHLYRNVRARYNKQGLPSLVSAAATAYTEAEFSQLFEEIDRRSPSCANYLRGIGISRWARACFECKRYNITNSNIAESLNKAVAKALEYPIVTMVESIRLLLMRWFYERREEANKHRSLITKEVEEKLLTNLENSGGLTVAPASSAIYQISTGVGQAFTVDLQKRTCTCKMFETLGYPCSHGLAAARHNGTPITNLVDVYYSTDYWRKAYSGIVMPVPHEAETEVPPEVINADLLPPQTSQAAGRPKKRRIPSVGENVVYKKHRIGPNKCSRCLQCGHNRATCKFGIP